MNQIDRKARMREYKETPRPAGVYRVRNTATGKSLVGSTADLPGMLNRQRFQLEHGSHPDRELQRDWNELGPDAFEFEEFLGVRSLLLLFSKNGGRIGSCRDLCGSNLPERYIM